MKNKKILKFLSKHFLLLIIIILGFSLRIYNINWDDGGQMHPDERAIVMSTLSLHFPQSFSEFLSPGSPLNSHFFAYGGLPLYLLRIVGIPAGTASAVFNQYGGIQIVGRLLSVIADIGTIYIIYKIAKKTSGGKIAIIASLAYSLFVFPIQTSHFYAVDILLTFFMTLTLYRCIKCIDKPTIPNTVLLSLSFALATSTKISAAVLLFPIFLAFIFSHWKSVDKKNIINSLVKPINLKFVLSILLFFISFLFFNFIFQPYAFIDYKSFFERTLFESQMTKDPYVFPYTLQYVGKIPYFYEIKNVALWGIGPFMFILLCTGIIFLILNARKTINKKVLILVSFAFLYYLIVGKFAVGWMRYMLPLYPLFAICVGYSTQFFLTKIKAIKYSPLKISINILYLILFLSWPFSFMHIYTQPNTRIQADQWINKNIPEGSTIAIEHWDDKLPITDQIKYNFQELPLYEIPDDRTKWEGIVASLIQADYIILASNRLYTPLQKLNDCKKFKKCYPLTSQYYDDLFSGRLKFKKIAEFTSYPTLPIFNIQFPDQQADESFTVYDHPKVTIFKKN